MGYRAWPAAVLTGAALVAACVVVGEHVVDAGDGCLGSAGRFTATPAAAGSAASTGSAGVLPYPGASPDDKGSADDVKAGGATADGTTADGGLHSGDRTAPNMTTDEVGQTTDDSPTDADQLSGCLDLDRIEIPAPAPDSDDRA